MGQEQEGSDIVRKYSGSLSRLIVALTIAFAMAPTLMAVTQATPALADTLGYPWPTDAQAPCEFGASADHRV